MYGFIGLDKEIGLFPFYSECLGGNYTEIKSLGHKTPFLLQQIKLFGKIYFNYTQTKLIRM